MIQNAKCSWDSLGIQIDQMWFSLTDDCNMRCSYCFVQKGQNYMDLKVMDRALDVLFMSKGKEKKIILFGGEPLINFKLVKTFTEIAKKKAGLFNKKIKFGVGTNCLKMDQEIIKFLKNEDFQISVTLDGKSETHNRFRKSKDGKPTHNGIIKNIRKIQTTINSSKLCCLLGVHNSEIRNLFSNCNYIFKNTGIKSINIEPVQTNHAWTKNELTYFKLNLLKIFNFILSESNKNNFFFLKLFE